MTTEHGYSVKPRSTEDIARIAEMFLQRIVPEHLTSGCALDLSRLVDYRLQKERILVYPVSADELQYSEAETRAGEGAWLEIWMRGEFYEALYQTNSNTNRARSTLAHEMGHAVLHAEDVRTGRHRPHLLVVRRALRSQLVPFRDSEWQAHTFAGALLMPRTVLREVSLADTAALAAQFQVSEPFVRSHLKRIERVLR